MSYLERDTSAAVGGAQRGAAQSAHFYQLQHPADVTNAAGWEVQCLADGFGWINALHDDQEHELVFDTRLAALACMADLAHDSNLEYRVYSSFSAGAPKK